MNVPAIHMLRRIVWALDLPRPPEPIETNTVWRIEIELNDGCRIRINEDVGLASLRRVLMALRLIALPPVVRIWLAAGVTDMERTLIGPPC